MDSRTMTDPVSNAGTIPAPPRSSISRDTSPRSRWRWQLRVADTFARHAGRGDYTLTGVYVRRLHGCVRSPARSGREHCAGQALLHVVLPDDCVPGRQARDCAWRARRRCRHPGSRRPATPSTSATGYPWQWLVPVSECRRPAVLAAFAASASMQCPNSSSSI
ncbi:hypothetical protein D3C86_1571440 [compost metagenome]